VDFDCDKWMTGPANSGAAVFERRQSKKNGSTFAAQLTVLRTSATILLALSFFAQTFQQAFTVLGFYVNQSYIASKLCENRYKPMLHCNGKCILAKKLQQEEKKEQQNPERKLENRAEIYCCSYTAIDIPALPVPHLYYSNCPDAKLTDLSFSIFHPPSVIGSL